MSDTLPIEDYLAQGGVLSSPANVPPRYRGELLRLMASFVDSELAGSAGFADTINDAPGIQERIAAARIVLEKTDHAGRVLEIMESFGADGDRYAVHHPWADRLPRDADIGAARQGGDMRLSVFHYPLLGWIDAVVMNVLMGHASSVMPSLDLPVLRRSPKPRAGGKLRALPSITGIPVSPKVSATPDRSGSRRCRVSACGILPTRPCPPPGRRRSIQSSPR